MSDIETKRMTDIERKLEDFDDAIAYLSDWQEAIASSQSATAAQLATLLAARGGARGIVGPYGDERDGGRLYKRGGDGLVQRSGIELVAQAHGKPVPRANRPRRAR